MQKIREDSKLGKLPVLMVTSRGEKRKYYCGSASRCEWIRRKLVMTQKNTSTIDANVTDAPVTAATESEMLHRIGQMTRGLHDSLSELGLDKMLEKTAQEIPDARDRLNYVATMTEQAADRVLNATDIANPLQDKITSQAEALEARWKSVMETPSVD
ncbi:Protein phosphatase CheZ [Nymphon striatum]|nr:Protein phosphatase CheZ [Nymphon striatum]